MIGRRRCCCKDECTCSPCNVPKTDLACTYSLSGHSGTTTLRYVDPCTWQGPCINFTFGAGAKFKLSCTGGNLLFVCDIYLTADCQPVSISDECSTGGFAGHSLTVISEACSPLVLEYEADCVNCPSMCVSTFTITP